MTARTYGTFPIGLWQTPEFTALTWRAQRLYMLLISQRATTLIGTLPLAPRRWAKRSLSDTVEGVLSDLAELASAGYAATDEDAGEAWVWQASRPRGLKHFKAALSLTASLQSDRLRMIVADWLGAFDPSAASNPQQRGRRVAATRLAIYGRDGFACRLCGWGVGLPPAGYDGTYALGEIEKAADGYRVRLLELDHVYPEVLGGRFENENLQTLCSTCNARKGARI